LVHQLNYLELAEKTVGYSGADIQLVCKEAAMKPLRKVFDLLDSLSLEEDEGETKEQGQKSSRSFCFKDKNISLQKTHNIGFLK
jgi:SpoVK/Ycf46/Vps4 family AAA+-type ATPase